MLSIVFALALSSSPATPGPEPPQLAGAVQTQRISLHDVVVTLAKRTPGRLLDASFVPCANGREVLQVRWLDTTGRRIDYLVEPATGAVLSEIR